MWGYRSLEPTRCCIASIALVLLKTGIVHPPIGGSASAPASPTAPEDGLASAQGDDGGAGGVQVNTQQLATAQKLLLFWRKPAVRPSRSSRVPVSSAVTDCGCRTGPAAQGVVGPQHRDARERQGGQDLGAASVDARAEPDLSRRRRRRCRGAGGVQIPRSRYPPFSLARLVSVAWSGSLLVHTRRIQQFECVQRERERDGRHAPPVSRFSTWPRRERGAPPPPSPHLPPRPPPSSLLVSTRGCSTPS